MAEAHLLRNEANVAKPEQDAEQEDILDRDHSKGASVFMAICLSFAITVDILQYSMPLAFLPSVLEDRGHSTIKIATAIGGYYWTGFLGQVIITSYQMYMMFYEKKNAGNVITLKQTKKSILYLIAGLGVGSVTLLWQAFDPSWFVHTCCRLTQGLAGAFIFFYGFLLCQTMFKDDQQTFSVTMGSIALNVAEVLGSTLGALIFNYWGQRAVFWFLGIASVLNQLVLIVVLTMVKAEDRSKLPDLGCRSRDSGTSLSRQLSRKDSGLVTPISKASQGWNRIRGVFRNSYFNCSILLIWMSAIVKATVEEMLPFHADRRWEYKPLQIGALFAIVAVSYMISAWISGRYVWECLERAQASVGMDVKVFFGAVWLVLLGCGALFMMSVFDLFGKSWWILCAALIFYGMGLGLTHTPANLLVAKVVEEEEGRAKEVTNGIFQTTWEFGGSLGFLMGGLLGERYHHQLNLCAAYLVACIVTAIGMLVIDKVGRPKAVSEECLISPEDSIKPDRTPHYGAAPSSFSN